MQHADTIAEARHDPFADVDDAIVVHQAIARLPSGQREIVERFFVRGESQAGIATALGIAEGTVASRVCRARQRLRVQLARLIRPGRPGAGTGRTSTGAGPRGTGTLPA